MLVDVSAVLLGGAADRLRSADEMLADPMTYVDDPAERAYYLRNRARTAARWLAEAIELVRIYWTKRT